MHIKKISKTLYFSDIESNTILNVLLRLLNCDSYKHKLTLFPYRKRSSVFFGEFIPEGGENGTQGLVSSDPKTSLLGLLANSTNKRNHNHQA